MARLSFHVKLEEKIGEEILDLRNEICAGGYESFDAYKERVGLLAGLERAMLIADEVQKTLLGE